VIRADCDTGESEITLMRWGLVPYFAQELKSLGYSTINARAEAVATSRIYSEPFKRRRCLVPADGFYEWKTIPARTLFGPDPTATSGKKKDAADKQPYAFTLADGEPFAFAGLWDRWKHPAAGGVLESFTIITTAPNELTASVHDRMPVILRPQDYDLWLSHESADKYAEPAPRLELLALLRPYPAEKMEACQAHPDVGNVNNNHPGLLNSA